MSRAAKTKLKRANGNTIATINKTESNDNIGDVIVYAPDTRCQSSAWRVAMQVTHCLISCIALVMLISLQRQLEAHNRNVESINRHTSMTVALKTSEEKAWLAAAILGENHGYKVVERKLEDSDYLGAALYPSYPADMHSVCADTDLHRTKNIQPNNRTEN